MDLYRKYKNIPAHSAPVPRTEKDPTTSIGRSEVHPVMVSVTGIPVSFPLDFLAHSHRQYVRILRPTIQGIVIPPLRLIIRDKENKDQLVLRDST